MKTRSAILGLLIASVASHIQANSADIGSFVRDYYAAYKAKDAVRLAQFYTPDATFVDPSFELDLKGPDQIRELLTKALAKYESLDWQIDHTTAAGDGLIVEGTMIGKLTGKTVRVPFVSIFHFRDGKISAQRDMFDVTHFLVQLGVILPPFGSKPAPVSSSAAQGELFDTIARMDSAVFDALNAHDVDKLMSMFTKDLEFYQDNDGLKDYQQCSSDFKKMFSSAPDIRRELIKDSLEVYPIKDYGAIEIGAHRFCHKEKGEDGSPARMECGDFKFAMIWRKTSDSWRLSRVISYGH